jgi:hypothetical protein
MKAGTGEDSTYDPVIDGVTFEEEEDREQHKFILNNDSDNLSEKNSIPQKLINLNSHAPREENCFDLVK